jgi:hypothetical protein
MGTAAGGQAAGGSQALGGLAGAASAVTPWATLGLGAVNIATDLVQASKQADAQKSAERAAQTAAKEQERLLSQDFFSALQVPTEAYGRAARETTAQVGQAVGALQEGDSRLLAGGLGKVAAAGIAGEAETRDAMAQDLYKLEAAQAQSAMNVNQGLAGLEGQRLAGAQKTAAEARAAELGLYSGAAQAGAGILNTGLGMIDSFGSAKETPISSLAPVQGININPAQQLQNTSNAATSRFMNQYSPQVNNLDWMNSLSFLNKPQ